MKFLLFANKFGDLGNRLFRFSRFYIAKPQKIYFFDFSFYQYAYLYSPKVFSWYLLFKMLSFINKSNFEYLKHFLSKSNHVYQIELPHKYSSLDDSTCESVYQIINKSNKHFYNIPKRSFSCNILEINQCKKDKLKKIFNLKKKYKKTADIYIKKSSYFLVGIHIRRGDYAQFCNGKMFFNDDFYLQAIKCFINEYNGDKDLKFLIISNEDIKIDFFSEINPLYFGVQCPGVDQALLEKCDHILGVESTFSAWPCFLHDIPQTFISKTDNCVKLYTKSMIFSRS